MTRKTLFISSLAGLFSSLCCPLALAAQLVQDNPACSGGVIAITPITQTLSALPGFLYSTYPAANLPDVPNGEGGTKPPPNGFPGWAPYLITARVTAANNTPISGCSVIWKTSNGNFFTTDQNTLTNADGIVSGYLRGDASPVQLTATLVDTRQSVSMSFNVLQGMHYNLSPAVYGSFLVPESSQFSVEILPTLNPPFTYYEVLGLGNVFYSGLQTLNTNSQQAFIFSLWGTTNCATYPQIVNDPTHICKPAAQGAEGCVAQCFDSNSPWQVDKLYRFQVTATPATRVEGTAIEGTNYQLVVTDVAANNQLYNITMWSPFAQNIVNPYTFIEQFAGNTESCMDNQMRQALWLNPTYQPINTTTTLPATFMQASRPFDLTYGEGSMCFNYNVAGMGSLGFITVTGEPVGGFSNILIESAITGNSNIVIDTMGVLQTSVVQLGNQYYGINPSNSAAVQASMLANVSNFIYLTSQCPNLGNHPGLNLIQCADLCLSTMGCTSISVATNQCTLRGCTTLSPPTGSASGYKSYTMTPASFPPLTSLAAGKHRISAAELKRLQIPEAALANLPK